MPLGQIPTRLAVILRYVLPLGKALLHSLLWDYLDRTVVRIGIRGGIVTIEHARARIVAIVSVAQHDSTTDEAEKDLPALHQEKRCKVTKFPLYQQVKERLSLYI
jgi:uncharacterized protein (DUF433 family)